MGREGSLEELLRERIRGTIELIVEQELEEALGAANSARVGEPLVGYRHGHRARTFSTSLGGITIAMPRARTIGANDERQEWRSQIIPRYQRRTARVDEAILDVYLSGTNTRRLRGTPAPLLRVRRYRRTRSRVWSDACGKILRLGPDAISAS